MIDLSPMFGGFGVVISLFAMIFVYTQCDSCTIFNSDGFAQIHVNDSVLSASRNNITWVSFENVSGSDDYYWHEEEDELVSIETVLEESVEDPYTALQEIIKKFVFKGFYDSNLILTGAKCDADGNCTVNGIKSHKNMDVENDVFPKSCFLADVNGTLQPLKATAEPLYSYATHRKYNDKYKTFVAYFSFQDIQSQSFRPEKLLLDCSDENSSYPLIFDDVYPYRGKIVLLLTQYYTFVDLNWIEIWLRHYVAINIDLIVVYSSFPTDTEEGKNYSKAFLDLISLPYFEKKIIWLDWYALGRLRIHAHAQIAMINHGIQMFRESIIMGADLDEILLTKSKHTIHRIATELTKNYSSWQIHWHSYKVYLNAKIRSELKEHITRKNELSFHEMLEHADPCGASPTSPHSCKAKWMFKYSRPSLAGVHSVGFFKPGPVFNPYKEAKWLNEEFAVLLHLRGIQRDNE